MGIGERNIRKDAADLPVTPDYQKRRIKKQWAITVTPENEDFVVNRLIPENPQKFPGGVDGNKSNAVNACIDVVRLASE